MAIEAIIVDMPVAMTAAAILVLMDLPPFPMKPTKADGILQSRVGCLHLADESSTIS
jgi:hypothetical protein